MADKEKKEKSILVILIVLIFVIGICLLFLLRNGYRVAKEEIKDKNSYITVFVGDQSLDEYKIGYGIGTKEAAKELQEYISDACGYRSPLTLAQSGGQVISVRVCKKDGIFIRDGKIEICGQDSLSCMENVRIFANMYLGYAFAGEEREHLLSTASIRSIPENVLECETPWIEEREPIICLWKTNTARGVYSDPNVSLQSEIMSYSDDQLYEYVKMMKYCGYTGIQVTDMCSTWAQYGGYEFVQQRIRFMADAAHSLGMKFTLWVWGAEFDGYGWVDPDVAYPDYYAENYDREAKGARECFDKYYSIYAELADCSDRVIMHFNDPGNLKLSTDIGFYANLFRDKCREVNPDINFGINCYTYQINLAEVQEYLGADATVYGNAIHTDSEWEAGRDFRVWARDLGYDVGVWSWNLTEMEIDQLAEMNVNAELIADVYHKTKQIDEICQPTYWSEMDSYHMVNLFSLYCSGQLLQNPDLSPEELLYQVSEDLVGEEYAQDLYEALCIIEDARTGESWVQFRAGNEDYILESSDYPAEDILDRCDRVIPQMEAMLQAELNTPCIPLAISNKELLSLILPHLYQIKEFAEFRIWLQDLEEMNAKGSSPAAIQAKLDREYRSIPEYNTVVGVWGQAEARAQYNLVKEFCERLSFEVPRDPDFEYLRKQRLLGEMIITQKKEKERITFPKTVAEHWEFGYGSREAVEELVDELVSEGLLKEAGDGKVYLSNWKSYCMNGAKE